MRAESNGLLALSYIIRASEKSLSKQVQKTKENIAKYK